MDLMPDYEKGQETITRVRYRLATPANGVELSKALNAAARERATQLGIRETRLSDDALRVSVEDDWIVIWWEVPADDAGHTG